MRYVAEAPRESEILLTVIVALPYLLLNASDAAIDTSTFATVRRRVTATFVVPSTIFCRACPVMTKPPERIAFDVTFANVPL